MKRLLIAASLGTLLSACSSLGHVDYECHLAEVQAAKCASMEDAYKASKAKRDGNTRSQSVFERTAAVPGQSADAQQQPYFKGEPSNYPDAAQQGMPVFKQPKVMRVWVAPYVDADGNLRSGEYTYFATPGAWNYGSLNKQGSASSVFEPMRPGQLGFTPRDVKAQPSATSPAKPPEAAGSENKPAIPASTQRAPETQSGITQPYQRLSN